MSHSKPVRVMWKKQIETSRIFKTFSKTSGKIQFTISILFSIDGSVTLFYEPWVDWLVNAPMLSISCKEITQIGAHI